MDIRYRVCPDGQAKVPGPSGPTEMEAVTWTWLTGKFPALVSGPATVSLLPALGCLPPLFQHWYTAFASALRVTLTLLTPVPKPASLKSTVRAPPLEMLALA